MKRLALIFMLLGTPALAAPPPGVDLNSPKSKWIQNLRTPGGGSCCSVADCRPEPGARFHDGHWWVPGWISGAGEDQVPDVVILRNEDSFDGQAWGCRGMLGVWYCFVPAGSAG